MSKLATTLEDEVCGFYYLFKLRLGASLGCFVCLSVCDLSQIFGKFLNVVFTQLIDLIELFKGLTVPPCQHGVLWPLS